MTSSSENQTTKATALAFSKIVGAGNDFVFVDARAPLPSPFGIIERSELARRICDRHFGVGADGLVFVENSANAERLKWDFYNNDGSTAEMCGNASRCMGRWAQKKLGKERIEFETVSGLVRTESAGTEIASHLDYLKLSFVDLEIDGRKRATFVNTGVPHAVVEIDAIERAKEHMDLVRSLRFHARTGPKGTNVTFLQVHSPGKFSTVTFERGVEDFTLSCGTGVLAAAAVGLAAKGGLEAKVDSPGGRLLVRFGPNWSGAILQGPAIHLYDGELPQEFVK